MNRVLAFVKLGRPRFLLGGVVLHTAGALQSYVHGAAGAGGRVFDVQAFVLGQCAITATQLMTHYSNDYFDVEADRLNQSATMWSGGSRVLVNGELTPSVARNAALIFGAAAIAFDFAILNAYRERRLAAFAMLIAALALSISYSAPPLRLHPRGLGAFTAAIVVGALTPFVGFAMQQGMLTAHIVKVVTPLIVGQLALIVVLDLPDRRSDAAAQKKTLAVRFGEVWSARLAIALVGVTYVLTVLLRSHAMLLTLPVGALLVVALLKKMWRTANDASTLTFRAVAWFASLSITMLVSSFLA